MKLIHELCERLESWKATLISALFLVGSLVGLLGNQPQLEQLAWGTIILSGLPLFREALEALLCEGRITSGLLISMAIVASIVIGEPFAAGEIALIMAIGELLEHGTVHRARRGLHQLLSLSPRQGRRLNRNREEMMVIDSIRKGDLLRVKPGETIPVDGTIESGSTAVNQSILTGESLPVNRAEGDPVYAGTLNGDGCIDIRVSRDAGDSSLQRVIRLVQEAGEKQAPIQREADRWAQALVPASLGVALLGFILLRLTGSDFNDALLRAVTVLVVFCPCALALATPTSIMAAIGQATRRGVVIKSGEALEALGKVTALAFDKTGTLTLGKPVVSDIHLCPGIGKQELLLATAALESRSEHPLARAIVEEAAAASGQTTTPEVSDFLSRPGRGVEGRVNGHHLLCGSETWMQENHLALTEDILRPLAHFRSRGMATMLLARDGNIIGIIALSDALRKDTPRVLSELADVQTILLTGDNRRAAAHFAENCHIDTIHADLLPGDKAACITQLQRQGHRVAMVGDGVNDAPALKQAQVGIAMSHLGSDIATEAADISLMNDELSRLPYLMRLARATLRSIRFNIAAALIINLIAVILGLAGILTPITGALVHNAGSLLVIFNAALLYDRKFD